MHKPPDALALDDVLANTAWIRRLARRLVADAAERDEVVQQVWLAALTQAPRADELRPWLAGVLRNVARMRFRAGERRRRREERAETAAPATPEDLVGRVEVERDVANALLEVDEPYRSTLLLRYYEDLSAAEIARRLAIPAATVRSRLKRGLDELRAKLDAQSPDDRRRWVLALVPAAAAVRGGAAVSLALALGGALIMKAAVKLIVGIVALVLLLWLGSRFVHAPARGGDVTHARAGAAWRMPGGIAGFGSPQPTVAGVVIPGWFGQSGAPVRRIAGRVVFAGAPVAGATVELGSALTDVAIVRPATRVTGGDGTFDFGVQPPARYSVAATAAHHSPAVVEVDTRDPTTASEKVELRLGGCESALFGHVSDASGGAIAGARLCYAPPRATACIATDLDGAYELCVSPQQMSVQVSASGYGAITQGVFNAGFGGRRVRRDFALTPEATIRGRVVRGSDGSPVVGAAVRTAAGDIGPRLPAPGAAVTDENGRFSVGGLAPGRHRVVAFAAGLATSEPVDVNAEAGHGTPEIVLRLHAASSIRGVVVDGNDPVAGATVSVPRFGEIPGGDAVTQSDGSFVLDAVPRGVVTLRVQPYEVKTPKTIVVDRPQLDGIRIVVEAMGSIAGRVTRFGKPYTGIGVFCPGRAEPVFTDGDGNYVLRGLRPGKYQIVAQDGRVGGFTNPETISLDRGEHRTGADIDLQYAGSIAGVVVEESGAPVGGVLVYYGAVHKEDMGEDTTAPDGTFVAGGLVGGDDYQPTVRANMNSATRLVPVADSFAAVTVADGAANVTGVRLVVKRDHLSIAGSTVGGDGQPVGDVHVTAFRVDSDETPSFNRWFDHPSAITAVDGHFSIDDLDAGRFVLEARGGDGSEATVKNITAGQKNVVITLQSSGAIDGLLVGFTTPPSEVAAKLDNPLSPSLRSLATIEGDSFHFRGLSAGSYLVAATGAGAGDSQLVQVQGGQTATVTLHNHGSSSVHGHLSEWRGGAAVVGMRCDAMVDSPSGTLMWGNTNPSYSDNNGDFTLDGAAGSSRIICGGGLPFYSNGIAHVTVVDGQPASVSIAVVKRREDGVVGDIGADLASDSALVARIATLEPRGAFARAGLKIGDIIVSVDGASVAKLAPMGIDFAIGDRPLGSHAAVGVTRAGKEIVADVALTTPVQF